MFLHPLPTLAQAGRTVSCSGLAQASSVLKRQLLARYILRKTHHLNGRQKELATLMPVAARRPQTADDSLHSLPVMLCWVYVCYLHDHCNEPRVEVLYELN